MKERVPPAVKRPRKNNPALLMLAAFLAAGLLWAAFALDAPVRAWQLAGQKSAWTEFAAACSRYGDWPPLAAAIVIAGIIARYFKARRTLAMIFTMLAASLLAGAIVHPLRAATGRARPSKKIEEGWYGPRRDGKWIAGRHAFSSFPSAHTTAAAAMATPLFLAGWRAGLCGWIAVGLIGWSRIYLGVHHPSDVAAGAILGWVCGCAAMRSPVFRRWTWRIAGRATDSPVRTV